jgi:diaminopimelate decarboxylase
LHIKIPSLGRSLLCPKAQQASSIFLAKKRSYPQKKRVCPHFKENDVMSASHDEISIAGYTLSWWTEHFKLPLHILYGPCVRDNVRAFKRVFENHYPNGRICYAAKANANRAVLEMMKQEGVGADASSYNEARIAIESGIEPAMIDLNGNCKEDHLLKEAITKGMLIVADSLNELHVIEGIARRAGKKPDVLLRISGYEIEEATAAGVFTAGTWTKFGVPQRDIPAFISSLQNDGDFNLCGFHTHIGSQIADIEPYLAVLGKLVEMSLLLREHGKPCRILNIGGGFPVSYVDSEEWERVIGRIREGYRRARTGDLSGIFMWHNDPAGFTSDSDGAIDLRRWHGEKFHSPYGKERMLEAILNGSLSIKGRTMKTTDALALLGNPLLIIEPGRGIVEDAGVTLARVGDVKKIAYHHNLISLEMGVTDHCESLTETIIRRWEIINDYHRKDPEPFETFVGGNLCFSGDMLSKYKISLQRRPVRGDILVIHDTGAYNSSFMAANTNSYPRPDRVVVNDDGSLWQVKKRDTFGEIFRSKLIPSDGGAFRTGSNEICWQG